MFSAIINFFHPWLLSIRDPNPLNPPKKLLFSQIIREWLVVKFGHDVFILNSHPEEPTRRRSYILDGTRAKEINTYARNFLQSDIDFNSFNFDEFIADISKIEALKNKKEIKEKEERKETDLQKIRKKASKLLEGSGFYELKQEMKSNDLKLKAFSRFINLFEKMMLDNELNSLSGLEEKVLNQTKKDAAGIREPDIAKREIIELAKGLRGHKLRPGLSLHPDQAEKLSQLLMRENNQPSIQSAPLSKQQKADLVDAYGKRIEMGLRWNEIEDNLCIYLFESVFAKAALSRELPFFAESGSDYGRYLHRCKIKNLSPLPPYVFEEWGHLIHPFYLLNGLGSPFVRMISHGFNWMINKLSSLFLENCSNYWDCSLVCCGKRISFPKIFKGLLTISPFLAEKAFDFLSNITSVSGWHKIYKTMAQCCSSSPKIHPAFPVSREPSQRILSSYNSFRHLTPANPSPNLKVQLPLTSSPPALLLSPPPTPPMSSSGATPQRLFHTKSSGRQTVYTSKDDITEIPKSDLEIKVFAM